MRKTFKIRQSKKKLSMLMLTLVMIFSVFSLKTNVYASEEVEKKSEGTEKTIEEVEKELIAAQEQYSTSKAAYDKAKADVESQEEIVNTMENKLNEANNAAKEKYTEMEMAEQELAAAEKKKNNFEAIMESYPSEIEDIEIEIEEALAEGVDPADIEEANEYLSALKTELANAQANIETAVNDYNEKAAAVETIRIEVGETRNIVVNYNKHYTEYVNKLTELKEVEMQTKEAMDNNKISLDKLNEEYQLLLQKNKDSLKQESEKVLEDKTTTEKEESKTTNIHIKEKVTNNQNTFEAANNVKAPKTGDVSSFELYEIVGMISLMGMLVIHFRKKAEEL